MSRVLAHGVCRFRRLRLLSGHVLLLVCLGLGLTGCAHRRRPLVDEGVPTWAMHVHPVPVSRQLTLAQVEARVRTEMLLPALPPSHLSPEQLAATALGHLEAGRFADATLWLSLANYRYDEELGDLFVHGLEPQPAMPAHVRAKELYRLRQAEVEVWGSLELDDQLAWLGTLLRGERAPDVDLRKRLAELMRTGKRDEETFAEAVRQATSARGVAVEQLTSPALEEAYLSHVRRAVGQPQLRPWALRALVLTPLDAFSAEALRQGPDHFSPRFCATLADHLSGHRQSVLPFLEDGRDSVRAQAALVVGMNPAPDQLPALERRWTDERSPLARLAVAYALVRHGKVERLADMLAALAPCPGPLCESAMGLLAWLPDELLGRVDVRGLKPYVVDRRMPFRVRLFAADIARRSGPNKAIEPPMREALLALAKEKDERLAAAAAEALANDEAFTREEVLARLARPSPPYRPLLARLAQVATAADLPLLDRLSVRFAGLQGPELQSIVAAARRVPSVDGEEQLLAWLERYPHLARRLVLALLGRTDLRPEAWLRLAEVNDLTLRALGALMRGANDAWPQFEAQLRARDPGERLFALSLAGSLRDPRAKAALWESVNFQDSHVYPDDALLRHAAMSALVWIALAEVAAREPGPSRKTGVGAGAGAATSTSLTR